MADSNAKAQALAQEQAQALAQDQEKMQAQEQTQAQAQEQAQAQGKDQDQVREQAQVWDQAQNQVQEETHTQAQEQAQAESRAEPKSKRSKRRKRIGIVVGVIIVVFFVASFFFDRALLGQTYARYDIREPNLLMTFDDYEGVYERAPVSFQMGDSTLRGYIYGSDNTRGLIIFRHGIFSQQQDYLPLITALVDRGWRVFAYDAIGCGESDGDSTIGMSQSMRDVAAAVAFVQESGMADGMKVGLWGHSWGGYGVAAALGRTEGVDACVTMSGFDSPMKILVAAAKQMVGPLAVT